MLVKVGQCRKATSDLHLWQKEKEKQQQQRVLFPGLDQLICILRPSSVCNISLKISVIQSIAVISFCVSFTVCWYFTYMMSYTAKPVVHYPLLWLMLIFTISFLLMCVRRFLCCHDSEISPVDGDQVDSRTAHFLACNFGWWSHCAHWCIYGPTSQHSKFGVDSRKNSRPVVTILVDCLCVNV